MYPSSKFSTSCWRRLVRRVGRPLGVEAQQHGIAVGEELLDRLVRAQSDVFALVVLDDQLEPRGPVIEPQRFSSVSASEPAIGSPDSIWAIFSARYSAVRGSAAAIRSPGTRPLDASR